MLNVCIPHNKHFVAACLQRFQFVCFVNSRLSYGFGRVVQTPADFLILLLWPWVKTRSVVLDGLLERRVDEVVFVVLLLKPHIVLVRVWRKVAFLPVFSRHASKNLSEELGGSTRGSPTKEAKRWYAIPFHNRLAVFGFYGGPIQNLTKGGALFSLQLRHVKHTCHPVLSENRFFVLPFHLRTLSEKVSSVAFTARLNAVFSKCCCLEMVEPPVLCSCLFLSVLVRTRQATCRPLLHAKRFPAGFYFCPAGTTKSYSHVGRGVSLCFDLLLRREQRSATVRAKSTDVFKGQLTAARRQIMNTHFAGCYSSRERVPVNGFLNSAGAFNQKRLVLRLSRNQRAPVSLQ